MTATTFSATPPAAGVKPDPLLTSAIVVIVIIRIGLIIGIIGAAIMTLVNLFGLAALLAGFPLETPGGASVALSLKMCGLFLAGTMGLGFVNGFFMRLSQIVRTVWTGTPFVADNADRLSRMGWLMLGAQGAGVVIGVLSGAIGPDFPHPTFDAVFGLSLGGLVLAMTMFILARVFRTGTSLQDDLEGTI